MKRGVEFVRYGGLAPVKQRGFSSSPTTFHSPPARKGLYAFPRFWEEPFLLGGDLNTYGVKNRIVRLKDKHGKLVKGGKYWDRSSGKLWPDVEPDGDGVYSWEDYIHYITVQQKPRKFTHNGPLWHHLGTQLNTAEIIKSRGAWVLTSIDIYKKAFKKEMNYRRKSAIKDLGDWGVKDDEKVVDSQLLARNPYKWHSNDNLEVFIERIK
jgi:hypothetical protein